MREIYFMIKYKFISLINRILPVKKRGSLIPLFFILLLFLILIAIVLQSIIFMGIDLVASKVNLLKDSEQKIWFNSLLLLLVMQVFTNNLHANVYRLLMAKDIKMLVTLIAKKKLILIGKLIERHLLQYATVILSFFVLILCGLKLSSFETINFLVFLLCIIIAIVVTHSLKLLIIIEMTLKKLIRETLIVYNFVFLFFKAISLFLLLIILHPFMQYIPLENIKLLLESIYVNEFFVESKNITQYILRGHWLLIIIIISCSFAFLFFKKKFTYSKAAYLIQLLNSSYIKNKTNMNISIFNLYLNSIRGLITRIKFIPFQVIAIVEKDFNNFNRNNKYRLTATFFMIIAQYVIILSLYWFITYKTSLSINMENSKVLAITHISVTINMVGKLFNRFSIDFEGKSFIFLLLLPVKVENIALAKILSFIITVIPINIVLTLIIFLFYRTDFFHFMIIGVLTLIVGITIALLCTTTFPNFNRESYLDVPSTRADIMYKIMSSIYLFTSGSTILFLGMSSLSLQIFTIFSVGCSLFCYKVFCGKLRQTSFKSFASINEFFE